MKSEKYVIFCLLIKSNADYEVQVVQICVLNYFLEEYIPANSKYILKLSISGNKN